MLELSNTIKVMVPTKDNDGKAIDYQSMVQGVTELVGGSTVYDAKGLWISNDKTYKDDNKLVELNTDNLIAYKVLAQVFRDIIDPLIHDDGQLAVWLQVNGTTFIIHKGTLEELVEVAKTTLPLGVY